MITPERHRRDRADDPGGARCRAGGDRPRHAARPDRRRGRDVRHRQLPRRRVDRPVGGRRRSRIPDAAKIAMLDQRENQPTVDVLRDQGFLTGFGIDVGDPDEWGDEDDPRIVGHEVTAAAARKAAGRRWRICSPSIPTSTSCTRSTNPLLPAPGWPSMPPAATPWSCPSTGDAPASQNVQDGLIGATSMQFPLLMAADRRGGHRHR